MAAKSVGIFYGVASFVAQEFHQPLVIRSLSITDPLLFKSDQARMDQVKWDGNPRDSVWTKPLIRQPEMRAKAKSASPQLRSQLVDPNHHWAAI